MSLAIQNLLSHAVTFDGVPCPPPTELNPYEFTDIPEDFATVRGFGGATTYKVTALDCGFQVTCKPTDATYRFLAVLREQRNQLAAAGGEPRFTIAWLRNDTGETWVGTGCTFKQAPAALSTEQPTAVTWMFNVELLSISPPTVGA